MDDLDNRYPRLSRLVRDQRGVSLEQLAKRAPAGDYDCFDLERLLSHMRDNDQQGHSVSFLAPFVAQVRGYLATVEEYVALGLVKNPHQFVVKKLMVPVVPGGAPVSSEMLDTVAECSWALWLHDRHGNVDEERRLLGGTGDADFFVTTAEGDLWVDCISVAPQTDQTDLSAYFSSVVVRKWKSKFGTRPGAATAPAAIAVTVLKNQENVLGRLRFDQATGRALSPSNHVWAHCPGLQSAWFGLPPFSDLAHRPEVFGAWRRP